MLRNKKENMEAWKKLLLENNVTCCILKKPFLQSKKKECWEIIPQNGRVSEMKYRNREHRPLILGFKLVTMEVRIIYKENLNSC